MLTRGASYHRRVKRADVYLKVTIEYDELDQPEKLAAEIVRQVRKIYRVEHAETANIVKQD